MIQGNVIIASNGSITSYSGAGVYDVVKLADGIYRIQMTENFNSFVSAGFNPLLASSGVHLTAGSFVVGTLYRIITVGNTNWYAIGLDSGLTPQEGQVFVATGVGSGTGTAAALVSGKADFIEVAAKVDQSLITNTLGKGALITFGTFASSAIAFTGDTNSNTTISNVSSTAGLRVGQAISGAGIPLGTTITVVGSGTLTISQAATATAAGVVMSASPGKVLANPAEGTAGLVIQFNLYFRNSSVGF